MRGKLSDMLRVLASWIERLAVWVERQPTTQVAPACESPAAATVADAPLDIVSATVNGQIRSVRLKRLVGDGSRVLVTDPDHDMHATNGDDAGELRPTLVAVIQVRDIAPEDTQKFALWLRSKPT